MKLGTSPPLTGVTDTFACGTRTVHVERFEPPGEGPHPAVILLHGADGLDFRGKAYRGMARELAGHGFLALLLHYFDATGTRYAAAANPLHCLTWMQVIGGAITYAGVPPGAAGARVGLVGFSLGAYLALAVAANEERVGAVVECFGGLHDLLVPGLRRMPPVLILHGDADHLVPVAEAYKLERLLKERSLPCEMKIYPGQGHGFHGATSEDALRRALAFLEKHVKGQV